MGTHHGLYPQLLCDCATGSCAVFCHGGNINEVGTDNGRTFKRYLRKCGRAYCMLNITQIYKAIANEVQVSIVALKNGEIRIVQSSMLGSVLSNILLVLGCCFFFGGIRNSRSGFTGGIEQDFNPTVASTMCSLMTMASASLIIPATVSLLSFLS